MITLLFSLSLIVRSLWALTIPQFFANHMVLIREPTHSRLWGWSTSAATKVTLTLDNKTSWSATPAAADGYWQIDLDPQSPGCGHFITITDGTTAQPVTYTDVCFGDVFFCSGQSNMQFSVNGGMNGSQEIADSINYPLLRFFTAKDVEATTAQKDLPTLANYTWGVSTPQNFVPVGVDANNFSWPSAVCYFFARDTYQALGGKTPVGFIGASWNGQPIEAFMSPDALADKTCGGTMSPSKEEHQGELGDGLGDKVGLLNTTSNSSLLRDEPPSSIWYGMYTPLLPLRISAFLWYQGEENDSGHEGNICCDQNSYRCLFPAFIVDIRNKWKLPSLPFYFVLLAAGHTAPFREVQIMAAYQLPYAFFSDALDLGDPDSPVPGHPRRKQEVGRRASLCAQNLMYGSKVEYHGPTLAKGHAPKVARNGSNVDVSFVFNYTNGLHLNGTAACTSCCTPGHTPFKYFDPLTNFTVYANITSMNATSGAISISAPWATSHGDLLQLQFQFESTVQCGLYNGVGGADDHTAIVGEPFRLNVTLSTGKVTGFV